VEVVEALAEETTVEVAEVLVVETLEVIPE